MATPTLEGTAKSKTNSTSITLSSITGETNECLLVVITFKGADLPTEVKWGNRVLKRSAHRINNSLLFGVAVYTQRNIALGRTSDIVATWASANDLRSISAITLPNEHVKDISASTVQPNTGDPSVTITDTLQQSNEFALGIFLSEGPGSDTSPVASGWTLITDDGTAGPPPVSNNHWIIYYQNLTTAEADVVFSGTGGTSRNWVNLLITFKDEQPVAWDKYGSRLLVGDVVKYQGTDYTVVSFRRFRNVVELTTIGLVTATETELQ